MKAGENSVVNLEAAQKALRDQFLYWQCRIRQMTVRQGDGRPTSGMSPYIFINSEAEPAGSAIVLVHKQENYEATQQFKHIVKKTSDPAERYSNAIKYLSELYFQRPKEFSDVMTGLFVEDSEVVRRLLSHGHCTLGFEQFGQRFAVPCSVRALEPGHDLWEATYWHNAMFNPAIPDGVVILAFHPDWSHAAANPPVS